MEFVLVDSDDCSHNRVEKAPVASTANLSLDSALPQPGQIDCVVEEECTDERGRQLVHVGTANPWGIESTTGDTAVTFLHYRKRV